MELKKKKRKTKGSTSMKPHRQTSSTKKNQNGIFFSETRHSKDLFCTKPNFSLQNQKCLLEPQHLVHGSSKHQTRRKLLLYLTNCISFLFLLYSPRENVHVTGCKSHRHALSVKLKSPGFLLGSAVSLHCGVFCTAQVSRSHVAGELLPLLLLMQPTMVW